MKHYYFLIILYFASFSIFCQSGFFLYADNFNGGVTGDGYSPNAGFGGTGIFQINIPIGSSIRNAILLGGKHGSTPSTSINFNGNNLIFDSLNQISPPFFSPYGGSAALHMLDVTQYVSLGISSYQITVPQQSNNTTNRFSDFYLYVVYENMSMSEVTTYVFINSKGMDNNIRTYSINNLSKINNAFDVGVSLFTGYLCDTIEGENIYINNNYLGLIGLPDINSGSCGGTKGSFYYNNNNLFGLQDDIPNNLMSGSDAICDAKNYVSNNDTMIIIKSETESTNNNSNVIWAFFLSYSSNCSFTTTATTTNQDTICAGENVQLTASGGVTYNWYSAFSTFNDSTLANPLATPTQTTTYIVTIKNDSGCVKTEHIKVWVNAAPKPDTITITPQRCGSTNGSVVVGNIPNGAAPFNYELTNLATGNLQSQISNSFNNLLAANYLLQITDSNGCQWQSDTLFLPEINDITANFSVYTLPWVFPFNTNPMGEAPLTVYTQNSSVNAGSFEWWVVSDESGVRDTVAQYSSPTPLHTFEDGGTFEICLLAYNNIPVCGDTVCKTVSITPNAGVDSLVLIVPNVFSPNHDGNNDNFVLQLQGADLLEKIEVEIFNRWGQQITDWKLNIGDLISNLQLPISNFVLWDGTTNSGTKVPEGTYFYVITYTKLTGEVESLKGTVTLLR